MAFLNAYSAESGLQPAVKATPPSTHQVVDVKEKFSQSMADRAGLDPQQPQLSSNGVQSGQVSGHSLASAECLLAETVVASKNSFKTSEINEFCATAAKSQKSRLDSTKSTLEEYAGARIDDAIIHVVTWTKGKPDGTWYQYSRHAGKWTGKIVSFSPGDAVTSVDHLLGHGNVAFLALHLGIDDSCKLSYDVQAKHTKPINQQDVADLILLAESYYTKGSSTTPKKPAAGGAPELSYSSSSEPAPFIGVWGGVVLLKVPTLPASITLTPSADTSVRNAGAEEPHDWNVTSTCSKSPTASPATSRNTDPGTSRYRSAGFSIGNSIARFVLLKGHVPVASNFMQEASPSDGSEPVTPKKQPTSATPAKDSAVTDSSSKSKDPLANMAVTVPNEGLHWWDVSVAMPVTSFNQLKYDSQNNLVVLKKTNDIKPYALVDFFPGGADLSAKNYISMLMISGGIPLSNQPLQKPFIGTGLTVGIKSFRFQPLVGLRIEKDERTTGLGPGSSANQAQLSNHLRYEWHAKLQVMIGFSISDAKKVLGLK
jgi:hypothetical protein